MAKSSKKVVSAKKSGTKKNIRTRQDVNENILALILIAIGVLLLAIVFMPSIGFVGGFLKSILLGIFSHLAIILALCLLFAGFYRLSRRETFSFKNLNVLDSVLASLFVLLVYALINTDYIATNSAFSITALKKVAYDSAGGGGVGLFCYIVSIVFYKLIGKTGIVLLSVFIAAYMALKYQRNSLKLGILNIKDFIAGKISGKNSKNKNIVTKDNVKNSDNQQYISGKTRTAIPTINKERKLAEEIIPDLSEQETEQAGNSDFKAEILKEDNNTKEDRALELFRQETNIELHEPDGEKEDKAISFSTVQDIIQGFDRDIVQDHDEDYAQSITQDYTQVVNRDNIQNSVQDAVQDDIGKDIIKQDTAQNTVQNERGISGQVYIKPTLDLLKDYPKTSQSDSDEKLKKAYALENTLSSFGIESKVENISVGPTITRYELTIKLGTKVSKITGLSEDLALALAAKSIRIEAPVPGKSFVGVEVPNEVTRTVGFKDVIADAIKKRKKDGIIFAMGKDISGETVVSDITRMPHALIAGSTGSGKSVCINTLICSILYNYSPDEVKLMLIDPKVVELSVYNKVPHLTVPVVTDMKKAPQALNWAVNEMEKRYKAFAESKSKDIKSYNEKNEEKMPHIVIIIDELADMMMVAAKEVEEAICRLAQKARACGIHLIVATQRPSVDVITGLIKANIPTRIAFAVSSQTDSRTILDCSGAEKLLGKGDMLYSPIGMNKPMRIQGAFVSEDEVERITDFIEEKNPKEDLAKQQEEVQKQIDDAVIEMAESKDKDELYDDVVEFAASKGEISVSLVQRQFRIGYNRASRIVEMMADEGIVGASDGSKPRKVIISDYNG